MIRIDGSAQRSFTFPAALPVAFDFYSDVSRILHYLPHITPVKKYSENSFRMLYSTTELGIYRVSIYCDLIADPQIDTQTLLINPVDSPTALVKSGAGIYSLVGHGYYYSKSDFQPESNRTRVDYQMAIRADLPVPLGVRLMPSSILEMIANNIAQWRMNEIIDGFIDRSLRAFHDMQIS